MWKTWKKMLVETIFPQFCLGCGKEGSLACEDCLSTIEISDFVFCPFCEKPKRVFDKGKCPRHRGFSLDGLFSPASYKNELIKKMTHKFKYEPFLKNLAGPLSFLIISHILKSGNENIFKNPEAVFLPVPLSNFRKRWRGYNQAEELAKILAGFFNVPIESDILVKTKNTSAQTKLKFDEREKNIKGVFETKNPEKIIGKKVFLVDDVFTTGATMEECAKILKQAGAASVWGVAAAREILE